MRFFVPLLLATVIAADAQTVVFKDDFTRADSKNIDASLGGITNNTGTTLAADAVYTQPWLDPNNRAPTYGDPDTNAANGGGSQIAAGVWQLKYGSGTANAYVNHNFINASILNAGGFSVSIDVLGMNQTTSGQGCAIGLGLTRAQADTLEDASSNTRPHLSAAFGGTTSALADFWFALRGDSTVAWGSKGTTAGSATVAAKTGTISAKFQLQSFAANAVVSYEVFYGTTSLGTGSFTWTTANSNYIVLDGRDNTVVSVDNFNVSTILANPSTSFTVTPTSVPTNATAQTVTLNWINSGLPGGATYQITADKPVTFPNGSSGPALNGSGSTTAVVNGSLGMTTFTYKVSNATPAVVATAKAYVNRPNIILIVADDLGWGDLGCYGSEIPTPNIDNLAATGVKFRQFYNSARCSPTRCSLLSGLYPQQAAVDPSAALPNLRNDNNITFAELLKSEGYRTYMAGKWHLGTGTLLPENRGFQQVWRFANGGAHSANQWVQSEYTLVSNNNEIAFRDYTGNGQQFYQTDAIGDYAVDYLNHNQAKNDGAPFAMYLAFGAPHFPVGAPGALADTYMANYARGYDVLREERYNRQLANGVIDSRYPFPARGGTGPHGGLSPEELPAWDGLSANRKADQTRRMALYAAMVNKVDENVGKVVTRLQQLGKLDNTLIFFVSDNGANLEGGVFGTGASTVGPATGNALTNMGQPVVDDDIKYGASWAHVSNTPLKLFKHFTHEGGIRAPFIVHWPAGITPQNQWVETPGHLIDVVSTMVAASGATYPTTYNSHAVLPLEGTNLVPVINNHAAVDRTLFVEHEVNRMARKGRWKLVTEAWNAFDGEFTTHEKLLYDMDVDPGESTNLADDNPGKVVELTDEWNAWSTRVGLPSTRLMTAPPLNVIPAPTPYDLFVDTFNRTNTSDIDAAADGMWGSRVPPIAANGAWFEGYEGSGAGSIQILDNVLQMAVGQGMAETGANHNFIGQDILDAGGFSVSLRTLEISTSATDTANRFVGFGVGLNATQAAGGGDISGTNPIRGKTANPGSADAFLELDFDGNVKLWIDGAIVSTVAVGKTKGTLTAGFACTSFAAGAPCIITAYFDGSPLDLDPSGPGITKTFQWDESNQNYLALCARASDYTVMDNFAVRKLPLSAALAVERAIEVGLQGDHTGLHANPDGDRLDNFGEWAFGTDPNRSDDEVAATSLVLAQPGSGTFRFAFRRLSNYAAVGLNYRFVISSDLQHWSDVAAIEESKTPLSASPGYEAVTLRLPADSVPVGGKLYLRIGAY